MVPPPRRLTSHPRVWLHNGLPWTDRPDGPALAVVTNLDDYLHHLETGRPDSPAVTVRLHRYWQHRAAAATTPTLFP